MEIKTPFLTVKLDDYIINEIIDEHMMNMFGITYYSVIKNGYVYNDHSEYDPIDGKMEKMRKATKTDEAAILILQTILKKRRLENES